MKQPDQETRKITAILPADLLETAMHELGMGVTETLRAGLEALQRDRAYKKLLSMEGRVKFTVPLETLREDRE